VPPLIMADMHKLITSTCVRTTHRNCHRTLCITAWIICTDGRCINLCHMPNFEGSKILRTLMRSFRIRPRYILEVDLEYPQYLHDRHTDLPFHDKMSCKRKNKLLATLYDKQHYIIYYCNVQQCTCHGFRITKIHQVLQFTQSPWLRNYIELNTKFRMRARFRKKFV